MMQRLLIPMSEVASPGRGYVPVLQDHSGERDALAALRSSAGGTFAQITPVLQIVGRTRKVLETSAVRDHVKRIAQAVGGERPFYLDFLRADPARLLKTGRGRVATAEVAYVAARKRSLDFIPVAWTDSREAHINAAANAAIVDARGLALRHRLRGSATPTGDTVKTRLEASLESLQLPVEQIDLLLDLEYLDPDTEVPTERIVRVVTQCAAIGGWRRIVLLGSSIPATLGCISEGQNGFIERREWRLWTSLPEEIRERLDFGDYGIQHPKPPAKSGAGMRANIRYTLPDRHLIVRGRGEVRVEGAGQYIGLCSRVVNSGFFAGADYSWGDKCIAACSAGRLAPGHQNQWRAAGTAHHIRLVSEQLREWD